MAKARLLADHEPSDGVAFGADGDRCARDLLNDAATIASALPKATADSCVVLVFQRDRYHFAAALFGSLMRGHRVHVAPSDRRDQVMAITRVLAPVAILHDTTVGAPTRVDLLLNDANRAAKTIDRDAIDRIDGRIALHDPVTGKAGPLRSLDQWLLQAQQCMDGTAWPHGGHVLTATAPGHSLGLLLGVLAPLLNGGALLRPLHPSATELAAHLATTRNPVLLSAPRLFGRLAQMHEAPLARATHVHLTAPVDNLATSSSLSVPQHTPLIEWLVRHPFGPIAFRNPSQSTSFTAMTQLHITEASNSAMRIESQPFANPATTGDRIAVRPDGTFDLLSSEEHSLEVAGVRLDVSVLARALTSIDGVSDAAVLAVQGNAQQAPQVLVACEARGALAPTLRGVVDAYLATSAPGLACELICVDALPTGADGECVRADVLRLFGLGPSGQRPNYTMTWHEVPADDGDDLHHIYQIEVPQDCAYFEGHFAGYPILPAAAQLSALVLPAVRRSRPDFGPLHRMVRLKFLDRITPGDHVLVELKFKHGTSTVEFALKREGVLCSAGQLELSPPPCP